MQNLLNIRVIERFLKYRYWMEFFYGKIVAIKDLVTWQSDTVEGITKEFHSCVDDYLDFCKEIGKEPEKPEVK